MAVASGGFPAVLIETCEKDGLNRKRPPASRKYGMIVFMTFSLGLWSDFM
jgi:hypothetical protein